MVFQNKKLNKKLSDKCMADILINELTSLKGKKNKKLSIGNM